MIHHSSRIYKNSKIFYHIETDKIHPNLRNFPQQIIVKQLSNPVNHKIHRFTPNLYGNINYRWSWELKKKKNELLHGQRGSWRRRASRLYRQGSPPDPLKGSISYKSSSFFFFSLFFLCCTLTVNPFPGICFIAKIAIDWPRKKENYELRFMPGPIRST